MHLLPPLFLLISLPSSSLAFRDQSVGVRGRLMCGNSPLSNTSVKLWDKNYIGKDEFLNETKTDRTGFFQITAFGKGVFEMNVHFKVYHNCDDEILPCLRKVTLGVPSSFVTRTPNVISFFEAGTMNMAFRYPSEERAC